MQVAAGSAHAAFWSLRQKVQFRPRCWSDDAAAAAPLLHEALLLGTRSPACRYRRLSQQLARSATRRSGRSTCCWPLLERCPVPSRRHQLAHLFVTAARRAENGRPSGLSLHLQAPIYGMNPCAHAPSSNGWRAIRRCHRPDGRHGHPSAWLLQAAGWL